MLAISNDLKNNGYSKVKNFIKKRDVEIILKDIKPYIESVDKFTNYNDSFIFKNETIFELPNLAAVSDSALKIVLSSTLINNVKNYFGEEVLLGKFRYINQLRPQTNHLYTHVDPVNCVLILLSLKGQNNLNGPTFFFKKSLELRHKLDNVFVSPEIYKSNSNNGIDLYVANDLEPGDMTICDVRTWHGRIAPQIKGRELIWMTLFPVSNRTKTENNLFSTSSIASLNEIQKQCIGIYGSNFIRQNENEQKYFQSPKSPSNKGKIGKILDKTFLYLSLSIQFSKDLFIKLKSKFIKNKQYINYYKSPLKLFQENHPKQRKLDKSQM